MTIRQRLTLITTTAIEVPVHKLVTFPILLICGAMPCAPAAFAQQADTVASPNAGAPNAGASPYAGPETPMETGARADVAAASATGTPVVNPPDPQNAGTLAENARTTALANYPWSTADIWFGRR
jgi:hypothetical protein